MWNYRKLVTESIRKHLWGEYFVSLFPKLRVHVWSHTSGKVFLSEQNGKVRRAWVFKSTNSSDLFSKRHKTNENLIFKRHSLFKWKWRLTCTMTAAMKAEPSVSCSCSYESSSADVIFMFLAEIQWPLLETLLCEVQCVTIRLMDLRHTWHEYCQGPEEVQSWIWSKLEKRYDI